jgi:hypothetical protein
MSAPVRRGDEATCSRTARATAAPLATAATAAVAPRDRIGWARKRGRLRGWHRAPTGSDVPPVIAVRLLGYTGQRDHAHGAHGPDEAVAASQPQAWRVPVGRGFWLACSQVAHFRLLVVVLSAGWGQAGATRVGGRGSTTGRRGPACALGQLNDVYWLWAYSVMRPMARRGTLSAILAPSWLVRPAGGFLR